MLGLSTSAYGHNFTFLTTFHSIKKTEFGLINQKPPELPISHFQIGVNEQILNKISFLDPEHFVKGSYNVGFFFRSRRSRRVTLLLPMLLVVYT